MAQVYHDKMFNPVESRERIFPDDFLLVAEVDSNNVEDIYVLTNHIDQAWWNNLGVKKIVESRSTSIGDVVVLESGDIYVCRTLGWVNIGNIQNQPLSFMTGLTNE